jgi:hypothetical protein
MVDKKRNWKENNARSDDDTVWDKAAEPNLEGQLLKIENGVGPNHSTMYTIKKDDDSEVKVWGSTVLDDRFLGVPEGTYVKVTYEGLKQGKAGKSYHNYKVFIDEDSVPQESPKDKVITNIDEPIDLKGIPF